MSKGLLSVGDKVTVAIDKTHREAVVTKVSGIMIQCGVNLLEREEQSLWPTYWFEPYQITKNKENEK